LCLSRFVGFSVHLPVSRLWMNFHLVFVAVLRPTFIVIVIIIVVIVIILNFILGSSAPINIEKQQENSVTIIYY